MSFLEKARFWMQATQFGKVVNWSSQRVTRVRNRRLGRLLRFAVEKSPFYRRRFQGLDLNRIELAQLPPCGKEELMEHFEEVVTDPAVHREDVARFMEEPANLGRYYLDRYVVSHTSGSQGQPALLLQDRHTLDVLLGILMTRGNAYRRPGVMQGLRHWRHPARLAIITLGRGFFPSGAAFEFLTERAGRFVNMLRLSSRQPDLVERLNTFQPQVLVAYASDLEALALQARHLHLAPQLRYISNSSEQLTDRARDRIQTAFGVPVMNHYGAGECLFLAEGCATHPGAHINADWVVLEVVDEAYRPVPVGEPGSKILVTNLANTVQPIIRYEIGDRVVMATEPCRCGNRLPRIGRIEGRSADVFWVGDETRSEFISGPLLQVAVDELGDVREWQAIQRTRNDIELRMELLPSVSTDLEQLSARLWQKLNGLGFPPCVQLQLQIVPSIAPDPRTGKLRRMLSEAESP